MIIKREGDVDKIEDLPRFHEACIVNSNAVLQSEQSIASSSATTSTSECGSIASVKVKIVPKIDVAEPLSPQTEGCSSRDNDCENRLLAESAGWREDRTRRLCIQIWRRATMEAFLKVVEQHERKHHVNRELRQVSGVWQGPYDGASQILNNALCLGTVLSGWCIFLQRTFKSPILYFLSAIYMWNHGGLQPTTGDLPSLTQAHCPLILSDPHSLMNDVSDKFVCAKMSWLFPSWSCSLMQAVEQIQVARMYHGCNVLRRTFEGWQEGMVEDQWTPNGCLAWDPKLSTLWKWLEIIAQTMGQVSWSAKPRNLKGQCTILCTWTLVSIATGCLADDSCVYIPHFLFFWILKHVTKFGVGDTLKRPKGARFDIVFYSILFSPILWDLNQLVRKIWYLISFLSSNNNLERSTPCNESNLSVIKQHRSTVTDSRHSLRIHFLLLIPLLHWCWRLLNPMFQPATCAFGSQLLTHSICCAFES